MTASESREVFRILLAGWPTQRQRMSSDDVQAMALFYTDGLGDLEFATVKSAILRVGRTSEFMPTVAAIRAAIGVIEHGPQMAGGEAWGAVIKAQRRHGSHATPGVDFTFADPITARVVKALGWREICAGTIATATADRARFIETYDQIARTERTEAQAADGATNPQLERGSVARELVAGIAKQLTKETP